MLARDERRNRRKYIITKGPQEIIKQMEESIQEKIAESLGLRSQREGIENSFKMS